MTLTPAYGHDYKTAKAAKADFHADKDFIIEDIFSKWDGKSVSKSQLSPDEQAQVILRFKKLTRVTGV